MKDIKIDKGIENKVEEIFLVGKRCADIKKQYPRIWKAIITQFNLDEYRFEDYTVSSEIFKHKLYVEILNQHELDEKKQKKEINTIAKNMTSKNLST